jgi:glycosyltransferase involved in cell wall biosynthesis
VAGCQLKLHRLLLVSHTADKTGAPLFLANFANWLKREMPDIELDILLKQTGELRPLFASAGRCYSWRLEDTRPVRFVDRFGIWGKRRERYVGSGVLPRWYQAFVLRWFRRRQYDLVFINSFANADLIPLLADAVGRPVICRAPELESVVETQCGKDAVALAIPRIARFIAVSDLVKDYMVDSLNVEEQLVSKVPGFYRPPGKSLLLREEARRELDIPTNAFVVCGCGSISARKGTDLFVAISQRLLAADTGVDWYFVWIGEVSDRAFFNAVSHEATSSSTQGRVRFVGKVDDPYEWFCASDALALTSREDPFPLVAIEAAHAGLPVVCFDGPVGTRELAEQGAVMLAKKFSVEDFSRNILELSADADKRRVVSDRARQVSADYTIDRIGFRILQLMLSEVQ